MRNGFTVVKEIGEDVFFVEEALTLRDAIAVCEETAYDVIEGNGDGSWFTYYPPSFQNGGIRNLHVPRETTQASRRRIGRLINALSI